MSSLARRADDVLDLLVAGLDVAQIAERLSLSRHTVRHHAAALRQRHYVRTTRQLVAKVLADRRDEQIRALVAERDAARRERDDCLARHGEIDRRRRDGGGEPLGRAT